MTNTIYQERLQQPLIFRYREEEIVQIREDEENFLNPKPKAIEPQKIDVFIVKNSKQFVVLDYDEIWSDEEAHKIAGEAGVKWGRVRRAQFTDEIRMEDRGWQYYRVYDNDSGIMNNFR